MFAAMELYVPADPQQCGWPAGSAIVGMRVRGGMRVAVLAPSSPRERYGDLVSRAAQQLRRGHQTQIVDLTRCAWSATSTKAPR